MAILKKANTYYAYFRDLDGRQVKRSLHTGDRDIAIVREKQLKVAIQEVKFRAACQRMRPDEPQITTAFPQKEIVPGEHQHGSLALNKMLECAATKRDIATEHISAWKKFIAEVPAKYADEVTPQMAQEYLDKNYSNGNGKTYNNIKGYLNVIFRCCLVEANITQSPFAPVVNRKVKKTKSKPWRNLTLEEFDKAFANAPAEYMRIMMMLSRWTAQRLETCAKMTPEMFDFDRKAFIIDPSKTKRFDKWVCCPILPELENFIKPLLSKCKDPQEPIVGYFQYPGNWSMSQKFTAHLLTLGISGNENVRVGFHSIRGTAITWFKENGVQGEELRSITGHTTAKMEDKYARAVANISKIAKEWNK